MMKRKRKKKQIASGKEDRISGQVCHPEQREGPVHSDSTTQVIRFAQDDNVIYTANAGTLH